MTADCAVRKIAMGRGKGQALPQGFRADTDPEADDPVDEIASDSDDAEVLTRKEMLGRISAFEAQIAIGLVGATGKLRRELQAQLRQCSVMRARLAAVLLADEVS